MPWQIEKLIEVAKQLKHTGQTQASTGEQIAAAFILNQMNYLPEIEQDIIQAWDQLGSQWQGYVRTVKNHHMDQIQGK